MTAPATLSRERIEKLIEWCSKRRGFHEVKNALRELLHLREQVEALREYVDFLCDGSEIPDDELYSHSRALRARIGRNADGEWSEAQGKEDKL